MKAFLLAIFFFSTVVLGQECDVLGIGAPCIDIMLLVEDEFLETIPGKKGGSLQIEWTTFSKILERSEVRHPLIITGGSCSNTIKGLASLGQRSALFGKIGRDKMGQHFLNNVVPIGVMPWLIASDTPTAQVACFVTPDRQRTFRCFPGAGNELTEEDLFPELFEGVKLVHVEAYAFYNGSLATRAMQLAKEAGAIVSLDLGCFELVEHFRHTILGLLPDYVDIIFANEDEIYALTGLGPRAGCNKLKQMCPIAVVSVGENGCWVGSGEKIFHSPAFPIEVVDTAGAGDLFASGFLHGYLEGCSLKECARYGNLAGSAVVGTCGAEIPTTQWTKLKKRMQTGE